VTHFRLKHLPLDTLREHVIVIHQRAVRDGKLGLAYGSAGEMTSLALLLAAIAAAIDFLVNFFEDLFGGSERPPTPRQLQHGRHPLYPVILGISDSLIPTMESKGKPDFCGDPDWCGKKPLQKQPLPGYNWCGPGNNGCPPTNDTDRCCETHDLAYGSSFSGWDVVKSAVVGGEKPRQLIADRVLCACLRRNPAADFKDVLVQTAAEALFCH